MIDYLKKTVKSYLFQNGYKLERKLKPLLEHPEAELKVKFDHILCYHAMKKPDFFFVQIGANDGVGNDPINRYINNFNWHGILVEPQEKVFKTLVENYNGKPNLNFKKVAIADKRETRILYKIREDAKGLPSWAYEIASFKLDTILSHKSIIPDLENLIVEEKVECITLMDLFNEALEKTVDLLQIDVEGYDYEIIKLLDFSKTKPHILHFEHGHLTEEDFEECLNLLIQNGYSIAVEQRDTTAYLED